MTSPAIGASGAQGVVVACDPVYILNRAQQGNIASQLQGGGMQNMNLQAIVTGEQLRFILNTNSRRRGKGEYVTSTHQ